MRGSSIMGNTKSGVNHTKSYCRFRSGIVHIELQLETVDAALDLLNKVCFGPKERKMDIHDALGSLSNRYKRLNMPVSAAQALVNRSRKNNYHFAFHSLYSFFGGYFRSIVGEIYGKNPLMIVGKAPDTIQFQEIVRLGSFEAVADFMVERVFRKLETSTRSTTKLLDKILEGTGVVVSSETLQRAHMYLEVRHLLVHRSGRVDSAFLQKYVSKLGFVTSLNGQLPFSLKFAKAALAAVTDLIGEIDAQLVANGFADPADNKKSNDVAVAGPSVGTIG